ncbi:MAG TPA: shikimate kinase [Thermoplasmata archaeon]|nr:shikimate kinase [Thermoplasmata archaeon]
MNGIGSAWGAMSFVNAIPTGIGAAAAISLLVRAEVELTPPRGEVGVLQIPGPSDTPLVRTSLLEALRSIAPDEAFDVDLRLNSSIPPGRGLKSSSAVPVAILRAVASAAGTALTASEAASFSATVGRAAGVSATGAFDDAAASAMGGIVVADTTEHRLLRHDAPAPEWTAVLWVPRETHRPAPEWFEAFRERAGAGRGAADAARLGRYLVALDRNTELVEEVMGYDYRPLRLELRRQGALAAGVSGLGPTLAAIVPSGSRSKVNRAMPVGRGEVLAVDLVQLGELSRDRGAP